MPSRSSIDVVADLQQVAENIRRYQDDLAANADLVARMSRHPAWYALRRNNGRWLFGPSKFIGYAGITAQRYLGPDRKSTRLNSSHLVISYAVFCLKKKKSLHVANP